MKRLSAGLVALMLASCASTPGFADPMERRVSQLLSKTTGSWSRQQKAFRELEALGKDAVPYLVGHLGDMRALEHQEISLANRSPDAFEGIRHYSPDTVHDAIAAILNQLTGQSFIPVYNEATAAERQENRLLWQEWCRATYPNQIDACDGA